MPQLSVLDHTLSSNESAEPILYLHGFLGCQEDWRETIDRLGGSFRHLTVDLPGHRMPADSLSSDRYSIHGCARLVIDLMDRLSIGQIHLVAYSMGGRLGLYLLTQVPERFGRAVIESASPGLKTESERKDRRTRDRQFIERLTTEPFEPFLNDWYAQPLFDTIDQSDPRFAALLDRRRGHDPKALALSLDHMSVAVQPSLWDRLPDLPIPVLFVAGSEDEKYRRLAEEMADLCPHGQSAIIPAAGHNPHWENPDEFVRAVRLFLAG